MFQTTNQICLLDRISSPSLFFFSCGVNQSFLCGNSTCLRTSLQMVNRGFRKCGYPQIIRFGRIFQHNSSSSWGIPMTMEPPKSPTVACPAAPAARLVAAAKAASAAVAAAAGRGWPAGICQQTNITGIPSIIIYLLLKGFLQIPLDSSHQPMGKGHLWLKLEIRTYDRFFSRTKHLELSLSTKNWSSLPKKGCCSQKKQDQRQTRWTWKSTEKRHKPGGLSWQQQVRTNTKLVPKWKTVEFTIIQLSQTKKSISRCSSSLSII